MATDSSNSAGVPLGHTLLQLGVNYGGQSAKVLCYGEPSYSMGICLGYAVGL